MGPVLGPHARIDRTRDTRVGEPWLPAPEDGRSGEGQRLTPGAPHNGGRHPPPGRPSATPTASNAGPQGRTLWRRCRVHTPASTAPGTHGSRNPGCPLQRTGGRGRDSACHQAPLTTVEGTPPGDALPPPRQRATPARKGARCGAGAGSTRPHRPHPGHTGRGTLAARSRGRAAEGGTAPDTRRPSHWWKAPPPGTPFRHPHSEQRRPAKAHAGGPVLGSHARIDRTRDTRVAEPWQPAPEDGRPGEGQRLTPGAPHNTVEGAPPGDALPPPPQRAMPARKGARRGAGAGSTRPHRPHPGHTGRGTLAARSRGRAVGGGTAPDTRRPSQRWKAPPPWDALPPPPQRATPARKGARSGAGAGSTRPHQPHPGHTGRGTLAARSRGRAAGGGTAPDTRRPSQRWKAPPPGTPFRHPHSEQRRPAGAHAGGLVLGSHARIDRTRDTRVAEPRPPAPEDGRSGEGQRLHAPLTTRWKAPHPGTPFRHPHSEQRRPARAHAVGPVLGPPARIDRTRDTRVAEPWLPAPEDGRPGEGQRLTPGAPHNGGRHPPRGRPSATPTASNAGPQGRTLGGRCWVHTPVSTAPGTHGSRNPGSPLQRTGGRGRDSA